MPQRILEIELSFIYVSSNIVFYVYLYPEMTIDNCNVHVISDELCVDVIPTFFLWDTGFNFLGRRHQ